MRLSIPLAGLLAASLTAGAQRAYALTFEVGPGKTYANVGDVPWESLGAGDTVLIYHRAAFYKEKFVLSRVGTPSAPITVRGVLGPITVRNCVLHDSGNGFFSFSSNTIASRNVLVEGNYIYDNGNDGSIFEHNNYTESLGITFQYNHFGPLRAGAGRQQPQGPLGGAGGALQLDRGRQPAARPRPRRGQLDPAQRPQLSHDLRLR